jgi:hypothetical protein
MFGEFLGHGALASLLAEISRLLLNFIANSHYVLTGLGNFCGDTVCNQLTTQNG